MPPRNQNRNRRTSATSNKPNRRTVLGGRRRNRIQIQDVSRRWGYEYEVTSVLTYTGKNSFVENITTQGSGVIESLARFRQGVQVEIRAELASQLEGLILAEANDTLSDFENTDVARYFVVSQPKLRLSRIQLIS